MNFLENLKSQDNVEVIYKSVRINLCAIRLDPKQQYLKKEQNNHKIY